MKIRRGVIKKFFAEKATHSSDQILMTAMSSSISVQCRPAQAPEEGDGRSPAAALAELPRRLGNCPSVDTSMSPEAKLSIGRNSIGTMAQINIANFWRPAEKCVP
jgi:hypothetical protein